jgi:transcriptional regulator with XRE-family HTH domain
MTNGERLRLLRETIGANQSEFAHVLGVASSFISGIERNTKDVSRDLLQKLLAKYQVNINWLLSGNGSMLLVEREDIENASNNKVMVTISESSLNNTKNFGNIIMSDSKEQPGCLSSPAIEEVNKDKLTKRNISVFEIPLLTKEQALHFDPVQEIPCPKAYSGDYPDYTLVPIPFRFREYSTDLRAIVVFNGLMAPSLNPGDIAIFQATGFNGDGVYIYRMNGDLHISHVKSDGMGYRLTKTFRPDEAIPCNGGTFEAIGRIRAVVRNIE